MQAHYHADLDGVPGRPGPEMLRPPYRDFGC